MKAHLNSGGCSVQRHSITLSTQVLTRHKGQH